MPDEQVFIRIEADTDNFQALASELSQSIGDSGCVYVRVPRYEPNRRGLGLLSPEIIVALASAGGFTGLFQLLTNYLTRNRGRELKIDRGKIKVLMKGHSLSEEQTMMRALFPELAKEEEHS